MNVLASANLSRVKVASGIICLLIYIVGIPTVVTRRLRQQRDKVNPEYERQRFEITNKYLNFTDLSPQYPSFGTSDFSPRNIGDKLGAPAKSQQATLYGMLLPLFGWISFAYGVDKRTNFVALINCCCRIARVLWRWGHRSIVSDCRLLDGC